MGERSENPLILPPPSPPGSPPAHALGKQDTIETISLHLSDSDEDIVELPPRRKRYGNTSRTIKRKRRRLPDTDSEEEDEDDGFDNYGDFENSDEWQQYKNFCDDDSDDDDDEFEW